jgi:hypothetical protein
MQLDYGVLLNQPSASSQINQGIGNFLQIREAEAIAKQREQAQMQAQAQAERQGMFQQAFGQAFQSGDRQQLANLMGEFPDQYEQIKGALGFQDEQKATALGSLGVQLSQFAATDPQAAANLIAQNADVLRSAGPGYEPEMLLQTLQQDPAALADRADKFSLLALGPEKYFDVTGARAKIDAQVRGQDIQIRGQDIQQQEGQANRANAMSMKQLTLMDKKLDRDVQRLGQSAASETNELRRQELELKLQEKRGQLEQTRKDLGAKQETTIANMTEAARLATELVDDPNLGNAVGTIGTMIPTMQGSTQDVINKANRLQSLLTVDNLKLMTGVLTDRDIAFLTNVASGLNVVDGGIKGSEREVKKRLGEISTKMSEKLAKFQPQPTMPNPASPRAAPQAAPDVDALLNKYAPR